MIDRAFEFNCFVLEGLWLYSFVLKHFITSPKCFYINYMAIWGMGMADIIGDHLQGKNNVNQLF